MYFREEDDDVQNKKPQAQSVKVRIFQSVNSFPCPESGKSRIHLSQQVANSSAGPSRLQVASGFSWDVGLSSLKPASAAQESQSSDEEEQDKSNKVKRIITRSIVSDARVFPIHQSL